MGCFQSKQPAKVSSDIRSTSVSKQETSSTAEVKSSSDGGEVAEEPPKILGKGTLALNASYVVIRGREGKLGSGAYSVVYKCHRIGSEDLLLAVKEINLAEMAPDELSALHAEVEILKSIDHPNVIKLFDFFEDDIKESPDPKAYIVTELLLGGELFDRIVERTFYYEKEARAVVQILLGVMVHLHAKEIAHRDLKPENLLLKSVGNDHELKVADFGFAANIGRVGSLTTQCGTPNYVAPEILRNEKYGTSVDMWSIGVLTFVLLGGYPPFHDENQVELFKRIKAARYDFDQRYWTDVSVEAKDFISKLLVTDPSKRLTASQSMLHPWLVMGDHELVTHHLETVSRLKNYNAKRKFKAAARLIMSMRRLSKNGDMLAFPVALRQQASLNELLLSSSAVDEKVKYDAPAPAPALEGAAPMGTPRSLTSSSTPHSVTATTEAMLPSKPPTAVPPLITRSSRSNLTQGDAPPRPRSAS